MILRENILPMLAGAIGSIGILIILIYMNQLSTQKNSNKPITSVQFNVKQNVKKSSMTQHSNRAPKNQTKVSPPNIQNILTGSSFGLNQFEFLSDNGDSLLSDSSNVIMTETTVDTLPKASYRPSLQYPDLARKNSIQGFVVLNILIDNSGQVQDAKIIESKPQEIFDQTALNSVKEWQFQPAIYQGKKVKIWIKQRISFNLN